MKNEFKTIELKTPRNVEVYNYGVKSNITVNEVKAGGIVCQINGVVKMRLIDFPLKNINLWEGEEGIEKQNEGFNRAEAIERAIEVLG